ncbi:MAG TPA: PQQ-binding-like beta-propeller repeat protein [bacterium]
MLFLLLFSLTQNGATTADWPMFRGNPQNTGVASGVLPENPEPLWTFAAGDVVESSAAIADGMVYFGSLDGFLYALDFATGELKWKYQAADEIKSSPAVYNGVVYFGDELGTFHALDGRSGEKKWTFKADGGIISSANFFSAEPIRSGGEERVLFGAYDNFLYCLSAKDGALVWKLETDGYVHGTPAIVNGSAVITGCDGYLRVVDIRSGEEQQKIALADNVAASAAVFNDQVYVGTFSNQVLGVNLKAGKIAWQYQNSKRQFPFYSSAAVTKDILIVGGRDKMIHALDPTTGEMKWTFMTKAKVESSPVIVDGKVIVASGSGEIHILDVTTGKSLWQFETGAGIVASPSFTAGKFVIGGDDGVVYCFGEK